MKRPKTPEKKANERVDSGSATVWQSALCIVSVSLSYDLVRDSYAPSKPPSPLDLNARQAMKQVTGKGVDVDELKRIFHSATRQVKGAYERSVARRFFLSPRFFQRKFWIIVLSSCGPICRGSENSSFMGICSFV